MQSIISLDDIWLHSHPEVTKHNEQQNILYCAFTKASTSQGWKILLGLFYFHEWICCSVVSSQACQKAKQATIGFACGIVVTRRIIASWQFSQGISVLKFTRFNGQCWSHRQDAHWCWRSIVEHDSQWEKLNKCVFPHKGRLWMNGLSSWIIWWKIKSKWLTLSTSVDNCLSKSSSTKRNERCPGYAYVH